MRYLASILVILSIFTSTPTLGKTVLLGPQVLTKNENTISIKHSKLGKNRATEIAIIHCGQFGTLAVFVNTLRQLGIASISTWRCE